MTPTMGYQPVRDSNGKPAARVGGRLCMCRAEPYQRGPVVQKMVECAERSCPQVDESCLVGHTAQRCPIQIPK